MTEAGRDAFSQLLYPMLTEQPAVSDTVLAELAPVALHKAHESNRLRDQVLVEFGDQIVACAEKMADRFRRGGTLLACGNGGSATQAGDVAAEYLAPPPPMRPLPALSLTNDVAVVTAVANDVSFDDIFLRQIIALGAPDDIVMGISTSGGSENVLVAMKEARRRGMLTVGLAGYDGGRMAVETSLEHCFVVRSSSVHRIQEVQTTITHVLWRVVQNMVEV